MKTALALVLTLAAAPVAAQDAIAEMTAPDGSDVGTVTMTQSPNGVLVQAVVRRMAPGPHGFHLHEAGNCEPDFEDAGGHFAPGGNGHGFLVEDGPHAGDMPNLHVDGEGIGRIDVFMDGISLVESDAHTLFDDDGTAIIVHDGPDSYMAEAGAGARVACGVLREDG